MAEVLVQLDEDDPLLPLYPGESLPLFGTGLMGLFTKETSLGTATLVFTYDDVVSKLTGISATNNSGKSVFIEITYPVSWSREILDSEKLDLLFTNQEKQAYQITDLSQVKGTGKYEISEIEWRFHG